MARTESRMLELGTAAPAFELPDADGKQHAFSLGEQATLVMFICNHCPFVVHVRDELARLGNDYHDRMAIYAINSNDFTAFPADNPKKMKEECRIAGYSFPYLIDEDQSVATAYQAACTPDFYLFDGNGRLAYRGQLDGSRPGNDIPVDGADLRSAIDAVLAGKSPATIQLPSIGCNIKWKAGNEPA